MKRKKKKKVKEERDVEAGVGDRNIFTFWGGGGEDSFEVPEP
jgi:hypothetical protein